jgi:hypothetical protein
LTIWIAGLVTCAGVGAYAAALTDLPLVWSSGAVVGVALGVVAVAGFLHLLEGTPGRRPPAGLRR